MRKILYIIPLFIFAFTFTGGPPQGWYQQFMPDIGGREIRDITFIDSLNGYIATYNLTPNDTGYILKTTNGGNNWIKSFNTGKGFTTLHFIDLNTGYACGGNGGGAYLCKTINAGLNWNIVNTPPLLQWQDMHILNEDTIWLIDDNSFNGGVFRTTNGGVNWIQQGSFGSQNPTKIYMVDGNTGFISNSSTSTLRKTTNGGSNWDVVPGATGFTDIQFIDFNTGWKARNSTNVQYTTNGGLNWIIQDITNKGPNIIFSRIAELTAINKDTIWGFGISEYLTPGNQIRGMIHKTTDGGNTWGFQLPDTNIDIFAYRHGTFINKLNGWAYANIPTGVHTVTGGNDTTIYLGVEQTNNEIPTDFYLHQNYPNPFNPMTNINYELRIKSEVKLTVYDIRGKEVSILVDQIQSPGTYQYTFNASGLTSGVYFYRLQIEDFTETKKMLLVK